MPACIYCNKDLSYSADICPNCRKTRPVDHYRNTDNTPGSLIALGGIVWFFCFFGGAYYFGSIGYNHESGWSFLAIPYGFFGLMVGFVVGGILNYFISH